MERRVHPSVGRWRALPVRSAALCAVLSLGAHGIQTAEAQSASASPPLHERLGLGATVGVVLTGDRNAVSDARSADLAVSVDVPLPANWRFRGEFGRARWTFDGSESFPLDLPPEQVTLTRLAAAGILALDTPANFYVGAGIGLYRFEAELSDMPRPNRPGLHVLGGTEFVFPGGGLGIRLEAQVQAVGGPNASTTPGTVIIPGAPPEGRSRVFSEVLFNIGAGIGVSWRF